MLIFKKTSRSHQHVPGQLHVHGTSPPVASQPQPPQPRPPSVLPSHHKTVQRFPLLAPFPKPARSLPCRSCPQQEHHAAAKPQPQPKHASVHDRHPARQRTTPNPSPTVQSISLFLVSQYHFLFSHARSTRRIVFPSHQKRTITTPAISASSFRGPKPCIYCHSEPMPRTLRRVVSVVGGQCEGFVCRAVGECIIPYGEPSPQGSYCRFG